LALLQAFTMNLFVALLADDQGLAAARSHSLDPQWLFSLSWPIQISELADVMNFAVILRPTEFALIGQQSLHDLTP
jgi:hypothetical protein